MKMILSYIFYCLLWIWQAPQNLVGLLLRLFYKNVPEVVADVYIRYAASFPGAISLGNTILSGSRREATVLHEHGHQIQSLILGPFYLIVIGLPSLLWAWFIHDVFFPKKSYYWFYSERWANHLVNLD